MSYWGYVSEQLMHEDETARLRRMHRSTRPRRRWSGRLVPPARSWLTARGEQVGVLQQLGQFLVAHARQADQHKAG